MAQGTSFPKVPATAWRTLRARAATAPSTKFTESTVAALLDMSSPRSARDNIVSPMRKLGLITDEGALTDRGNKWRIDSTYAEACQEILDDVYPDELAGLTDDNGAPDKARVETWLQHRGLGGSNAKQMAATYTMIADKTPPEAVLASPTSGGKKPKKNGGRSAPAKGEHRAHAPAQGAPTTPPVHEGSETLGSGRGTAPVIHLDIQVHIPATADADQIDQIFASMAKHLYRT